jgi:hypothetical protein
MELLQLCEKLTRRTNSTVQTLQKLNTNVDDFCKRKLRARSYMNLFTTDQLRDTRVKNA